MDEKSVSQNPYSFEQWMIDIVYPNHTIDSKIITAYFHGALYCKVVIYKYIFMFELSDIVITFLIRCIKLDWSIYLPKQDHDVH